MQHRAVQIVCTIGPASRDLATLDRLIVAGMSVARLNFAHGSHEEHREVFRRIREASAARGLPVAVLQDLSGPKLRLGEIPGAGITLLSGERVTLRCGAAKAARGEIPVPDAYLAQEVRVGGPILIGDGAVELEVLEVDPPEILAQVSVGGTLTSGKGINAPGGLSARPVMNEKDLADLAFGIELGVDLVGVSYVREAADLMSVRSRLRSLGRSIPLVAKIETERALENLDEILVRSDAVMIARGDLSLEIPYERVPIEQKRIVRRALYAGRPVITATQMLQSMVHAPRPTRAEATDVANAVLDGTDAVMLSDETAIGDDPVRACRAMASIVRETETASPDFPELDPEGISSELRELVVFSRAAVRTARDVDAAALVVWSSGGLAARLLSRHRPRMPIVAPTRFEDTWRRMSLLYGVCPVLCPGGRMQHEQLTGILGRTQAKDLLVVVGHDPGEERRIPWMRLVRVMDVDGWSRDPRGI